MATNNNAAKNTTTANTDINAHNEAINSALVRMPAMPGSGRKAKATRECECGCRGLTKSRFVPGHDARLAGWVKRCERGLLVKGGDLLDQVGWIAKNASEGEAAAVRRVLEAEFGDLTKENEATGTDGK